MADGVAKQITSRVCYVEPNDIHGDYNGIPLTPDYSDFSIAFNLVVEKVSRYNRNEYNATSNDADNTMMISFGMTNKRDYTSFLKGEDAGDGKTFLSTYFTDIVYSDVKTKQIVEGIGVESINISFESFYTPTISIKFVDVRGASLFGKEAAVHERGKISADTVFGAFFTQPFPRYRLQIKGFYGGDVTLQLTCASFKGNFNSTNGNFEFTATLIGYNYALLTDIPFLYIATAPFVNYEGRKYWANHINTTEWQIDGKPMISIHEFMNAISRHSVEIETTNAVSETDVEMLNSLTNERSMLNDVSSAYNKFIAALKKDCEDCYVETVEEPTDSERVRQLVLMYSGGNVTTSQDGDVLHTFSKEVCDAHDQLIQYADSYNSSYRSRSIATSKFPNGTNSAFERTDRKTLTELFSITTDPENTEKITEVSVASESPSSKQYTDIMKITLNDQYTCTETTAKELSKLISTTPYSSKIKAYAYLFNLYNFSDIVNNRIAEINEDYTIVEKRVNAQRAKSRVDALPFKPTVGNIFKMIMAHLETFIHIVKQCQSDILESGDARSATNLNVNISNTDVIGTETVPPFPAVYSSGSSVERSGDTSSDNFVLGWVGDFSHNFIEEKVVLSVWKAMSRIMDELKNDGSTKSVSKYFPIFPADINYGSSPFINTTLTNIGSLAGYLGIRAAQIFGVFFNESVQNNPSSELISLIGRMDAYNYYLSVGDIDALKERITNRLGSNSAQDVLLNIALCNADGDAYGTYYKNTDKRRHTFENDVAVKTIYNANNRCPIFTSGSVINSAYANRYVFSRYYDENDISLVPSRIDEFEDYSDDLVYKYDTPTGDIYYEPQYDYDSEMYKAHNYVNRGTTDQLLYGDSTTKEEEREMYYNDSLFNLIYATNSVSDIVTRYEELKSGGVTLVDYTKEDDFSKILDKCWKVSNDVYCKYFDGYSNMFTVAVTDAQYKENSETYDTKNLFPSEKSSGTYPSSLTDKSWVSMDDASGVKFTSDGKYVAVNDDTATDLGISRLRIHQPKIYFGTQSDPYSLFGHAFYYMQNNKISSGETDADYKDRVAKVKALLFLHTFKYKYNNLPNFLNASKNCGAIEALPYGYLLLLGGLLWRNRYYKYNGVDPIIYTEGSNCVYKSPGIDYTLFVYSENVYRLRCMNSSDTKVSYNVTVASLFGGTTDKWEVDYVIENRLIRFFETFVDNTFGKIMSACELYLRKTDSETSNTYSEQFTATSFIQDFVKKFQSERKSSTVDGMMALYKNTLNNFFGNYRYCYVDDKEVSGVRLMLSDDSEIQATIRNLYYNKVIVLDSLGYRLYKGDTSAERRVFVKQTTLNTYLTAFADQIKSIVNSQSDAQPINEEESDKVEDNKTFKIEIYYYLKNLYDKWMIQMSSSDYYSVTNFFKTNFVFIDKFYRNIYNQLIINCDKLYDIFTNRMQDANASLFSVLGDIAKEHNCLFVSLADYTSFSSDDINKDIKELEKAFKPMTWNEMGEMRNENHFVIVYVGGGSSIAAEDNYYRTDGFDINAEDDIPTPFKTKGTTYGSTDLETRYGYNVPSFGVSFARQNQSIFKNITLTMDSPAITEISAKALYNVTKLASSNDAKVAFYGQDIYNVYKNYSYECEVEMLGDMKIQPLMYFQLLNIPMWQGAYMIKSVTHTMTPGNMITKFKGQKMSKYIQPFCSEYFYGVSLLDPIDTQNRSGNYEYNGYSSSSLGEVTYAESYETISDGSVEDALDDYICSGNTVYLTLNGSTLNANLRNTLNKLIAEIKLLPENQSRETWTICISSAIRTAESTSDRSEHYYNGLRRVSNGGVSPNAVDLQICYINEDGTKTARKKDAEKLFKVMDILATNHFSELGQLIFEGNSTSASGATKYSTGYYRSTNSDAYTCLHVSSSGNKLGLLENDTYYPTIFISESPSGGNMGKAVTVDVAWLSNNVPPEYKAIAKRYYAKWKDTNLNRFKRVFIYYCNFTSSQLEAHFGDVSTASSSSTGYTYADSNDAQLTYNPLNLPWKTTESFFQIQQSTLDAGTQYTKRNEGESQWPGYVKNGYSYSSTNCVFQNMTYGVEAGFLYMNECIANGKTTLRSLLQSWPTTNEMDETTLENYIITVSKNAQIDADKYKLRGITMGNKAAAVAIARAIAITENNIVLTDEVLDNGFRAAVEYLKKFS